MRGGGLRENGVPYRQGSAPYLRSYGFSGRRYLTFFWMINDTGKVKRGGRRHPLDRGVLRTFDLTVSLKVFDARRDHIKKIT